MDERPELLGSSCSVLQVSGGTASSVLASLNAGSFLLGMYGLSMFEKTTQGQLPKLRYRVSQMSIFSDDTVDKNNLDLLLFHVVAYTH